MRRIIKDKPVILNTEIGSTRIKIKFLLRPKCLINLEGEMERRWLEIAAFEEIYEERCEIFAGYYEDVVGWWENRWMN